MKRGGPISNEQPDKKKPAVASIDASAETNSTGEDTTGVKLTDFADELLVQVYENLAFKDRQVTRRVCSRLLKFVDESTQGAKNLSISILGRRRATGNIVPFIVCMRPDSTEPESSVHVEVDLPAARYNLEDLRLHEVLSSLPNLTRIRPGALSLQIGTYFGLPNGLFTGLMQHLSEQQVPRLVKGFDFSIRTLPGPRPEVHQALVAFERLSTIGVQTLKLQGRHSHMLLPTVASFPRLVSLNVTLPLDEDSRVFIPLLSSHPTLRELDIDVSILTFDPRANYPTHQRIAADTILTAFSANSINSTRHMILTSLAAFRNIRKLEFKLDCNVLARTNGGLRAFGNMIRGMENLECLGTLVRPSGRSCWQYLRENNITSNRLQELRINFDRQFGVQAGLAMGQGLQTFAPSLKTLCLRVVREGLAGRKLYSLWVLRHHPSLTKLELKTEEGLEQEALTTLQEGLGNKVKLAVVPFS